MSALRRSTAQRGALMPYPVSHPRFSQDGLNAFQTYNTPEFRSRLTGSVTGWRLNIQRATAIPSAA